MTISKSRPISMEDDFYRDAVYALLKEKIYRANQVDEVFTQKQLREWAERKLSKRKKRAEELLKFFRKKRWLPKKRCAFGPTGRMRRIAWQEAMRLPELLMK